MYGAKIISSLHQKYKNNCYFLFLFFDRSPSNTDGFARNDVKMMICEITEKFLDEFSLAFHQFLASFSVNIMFTLSLLFVYKLQFRSDGIQMHHDILVILEFKLSDRNIFSGVYTASNHIIQVQTSPLHDNKK